MVPRSFNIASYEVDTGQDLLCSFSRAIGLHLTCLGTAQALEKIAYNLAIRMAATRIAAGVENRSHSLGVIWEKRKDFCCTCVVQLVRSACRERHAEYQLKKEPPSPLSTGKVYEILPQTIRSLA